MATFQSKRTAAGAIPRYSAEGVFSDTATYTFAGEAAASVVQAIMIAGGDAPGGITVLGVEIFNAALGASVTIAAGVTGTPAAFIPATSMSSAGVTRMSGFPLAFTTDTYLNLTTAGAAATGAVTVTVYMIAGTEQLS